MQRAAGFTLTQLEAFLAVVETGSFTAAAELLGRAQPTVSREVRALEGYARHDLLLRGPTGSTPTAAGRTVAELTRTVLAAAGRLEDSLISQRTIPTRPVALACSPSIANRFLPRLLRALDALDVPPLFTLKEVGTGEVEGLVADGQADLGLCHLARPRPGTTVRMIGSDPLVLVASTDVVDGLDGAADLSPLRDVPLLAWSQDTHPEYLALLRSVCRERGLEARTIDGTDRFTGARRYLLAEGRAIAIVPEDAAEALHPELACLPLEGSTVPLCAVTRREGDPSVQAVVGAVVALALDLAGTRPDDDAARLPA